VVLRKGQRVITFNKDDAELLRSKGVQVPSHVSSPFALFDDELSKVYKPKNKPQLLFIGGEEHFPNKEGLTWFLAQIFPGVLKNNSNLKLFVTSRWSDEYKNKYKSNNVVFTGFVDNLDELMSSSILVTPIRIGSGIRVKVFTSMAKGLPVVSTTLGASGIPELEHYKNILLADDETEFAACINNVVKNENLRQEISNGAYNLSSKSFAAMQFVEERNKFYRQIVQKS
jgi:glycosyltransferase involved in cell wall biosynthesis